MAKMELRNHQKSYGTTKVIHGIDMEIPSGEFCVFVGPSGCGKSTLLRMIAGLEDISDGEVCIEGKVVNDITAAKRGLAMVFQSYALYPHMSVRRNLSFGLENINTPKAQITTRVEDAARMLQISDYLDRKPGQLSGGQSQRAAIGRAVVREPRAFLFDEPLSNLDAELRVATRGEISKLHQRLGNTMIYVNHDQVEAMTMADKIAVLRDGRLEQFGVPYSGPAILGVRLRDLGPSETGMEMHVDAVEHLGSESFVFGKNSTEESLVVSTRGQTVVKPDEVIRVGFDAASIQVFDAATSKNLAI